MSCPNSIQPRTERLLELSRKRNEFLAAIQRINTEHNELISFSLLPLELIRHIFLLCTVASRFDVIRHISQVCRLWRNIAIHFPALWSKIPTIGRINSFWLEEILSRSNDHSLTIFIDPNTFEEEMPTRDGLLIVLRHAYRIRKLTYWSTSTSTQDQLNMELIKTSFKQGTPLLSVLYLRPKNYVSWEFPFSECPSLRELRIDNGTSLNPGFLPNLTSLEVTQSEGEHEPSASIVNWLMTLAELPSLQTLVLTNIFSSIVRTEPGLQDLPLVNLPNLSSLNVLGPLETMEPILNNLIIPSTSTLNLTFYGVTKSNSHLRSLCSISRIMSQLSAGRMAYSKWNILMSSVHARFSTENCQEGPYGRPVVVIEFGWGDETSETHVEMFNKIFASFDSICSGARALGISSDNSIQKSMKHALPSLLSIFKSIESISLDKRMLRTILPILHRKNVSTILLPKLKRIYCRERTTKLNVELEAFLTWRQKMGYPAEFFVTNHGH